MTITDLRAIAQYHATQAAQLTAAAGVASEPYSSDMSGKAALHKQWNEQLTQLADAFTTFSQLTTRHDQVIPS